MKIAFTLISLVLTAGSSYAFLPVPAGTRSTSTASTRREMFGGAGAGAPAEDNAEAKEQMEAAAKAMGMSVDEYMLGMRARERLTAELDKARVFGGDTSKISVERDGNNPPKFLEIKITEDGKAMGKEEVSKALCAALKKASDDSRKTRQEAQKGMMAFINDEMKKMGKA